MRLHLVKPGRLSVDVTHRYLDDPPSSAKGAQYDSQGQALSKAKRVAPG